MQETAWFSPPMPARAESWAYTSTFFWGSHLLLKATAGVFSEKSQKRNCSLTSNYQYQDSFPTVISVETMWGAWTPDPPGYNVLLLTSPIEVVFGRELENNKAFQHHPVETRLPLYLCSTVCVDQVGIPSSQACPSVMRNSLLTQYQLKPVVNLEF